MRVLLLRPRFQLDDRTFTVLALPWYDAANDEWAPQLIFVPIDRSLPRSVSTLLPRRSHRRDEVLASLKRVSDRVIVRALRALELSESAPPA